jgi:hypothetical protein
MICDECGCDSLRQRSIGNLVFWECSLCGFRHGDTRTLEMLEDLAWADEKGISRNIFPLVMALKKIQGLQYLDSAGSDPEAGLMPSIYFQLAPESYKYLDKLIQLVETYKLKSGTRWVIDVSSRSGISFWLRPMLPVVERKPTAEEIKSVECDPADLAEEIERNIRLSWWESNRA